MMEYKSAIVNYRKVLSKYPQLPDIRKNIGYAYFQSEKIDDSLSFLKKELTLFPDNTDAYALLVYVLSKSNRIQENYKFIEDLDLQFKAHEESPNAGLGDFILGMCFKEVDDCSKATKFFRKALERGYEPIKCYVQLLDLHLIQIEKDVERPTTVFPKDGLGTEIFIDAIKTFGRTPSEIYFLFGLRYFENIKSDIRFLDMSINSFEAAARVGPDDDLKDSLFNLACINYNCSDFVKASEYFERVLEIEPENNKAESYLDCCSRRLGRSDSINALDEQCPEWMNLSREFIDKPDMEYKYKFKNDRGFILQNINNLALEFIEKGKFQEALKRFLNGLKILSDSSVLNLNTAIVYSWLNNFEQAEKYALLALRKKDGKTTKIPPTAWTFKMALKEGNDFSVAYNHLGTIYFDKREFNKSVLAFKKTIEIEHRDARGHFNLGCAYWALGHRKKAEEE